jgi:hypothetical protein
MPLPGSGLASVRRPVVRKCTPPPGSGLGSIEDGSLRLGYSRNPMQCGNVLALRLVAGLLQPRLSFSKLSKALSCGKFP